MAPTLTRRGWIVVLVVLISMAMAVAFGGRGLNAVVAPAAVLLVGSRIGIGRVERPTIDRRLPTHGFVGETVRVHLDVHAPRPVNGHLRDMVAERLDADGSFRTTLDDTTHSYDLYLRNRGVYNVGPASVTVTDVFDLWKRTFEYDDRARITVYPRIKSIASPEWLEFARAAQVNRRETFDSVREYRPGDPLRDIHWKSSAKADGLVVTEYAGSDTHESVIIGVSLRGPKTDQAAETVVSLASALLDEGTPVGVVSPTNEVGPGTGDEQRRQILELGARIGVGELEPADLEGVDVLVTAPADGSPVRIQADSHLTTYDELFGTGSEPEPRAGSIETVARRSVSDEA